MKVFLFLSLLTANFAQALPVYYVVQAAGLADGLSDGLFETLEADCKKLSGVLSQTACVVGESNSQFGHYLHSVAYCRVPESKQGVLDRFAYDHYLPSQVQNFSSCQRRVVRQ